MNTIVSQNNPNVKYVDCPDCKGTGDDWDYLTRTSISIVPCPRCDGTGEVENKTVYNEIALPFDEWQAQEFELVEDMELPI